MTFPGMGKALVAALVVIVLLAVAAVSIMPAFVPGAPPPGTANAEQGQ